MKLAEAHTKLNQVDKTKAPVPGKNKGDRGQWVESQIGLDLSSNLNLVHLGGPDFCRMDCSPRDN